MQPALYCAMSLAFDPARIFAWLVATDLILLGLIIAPYRGERRT